MVAPTIGAPSKYAIKSPGSLSPRIQWLRDYYFEGVNRRWNNEFTAWTTGTPWDFQFQELTFYIVPETYAFFQTFRSSFIQTARKVTLHHDFWKWSIPERKAWFIREVMVDYLPKEILPGDLLAGARFNVMTSTCLNAKEAKAYNKLMYGKDGTRQATLWFHNHGYGNAGATSGHLVPDYPAMLKKGWGGIYNDLRSHYNSLPDRDKNGPRGAQLRAMLTAVTMPRDLSLAYARLAHELAAQEADITRKDELLEMAVNLEHVSWEPARTFWEALQSLWMAHMLVMSDENYPGSGVSFGRIDQYLYPYWEASLKAGMGREFGKEMLRCFWVHCNTAYDAMIRTGGNQGITAGYGQLLTVGGLGVRGRDMTNDLTYAILEVIDEVAPILEPKPNVRLHRRTPEDLLDKVVDLIASSQGATFLINYDERSIAGLLLQAQKAGVEDKINDSNVFDYAQVGCLENTMCGNDRSGTVDNNLNLLKAVELALTGGYDLLPFTDPVTGKTDPEHRWGVESGDAEKFTTWEQFWSAYAEQTRYIIKKITDLYERSEALRARFSPTPYLSCLVRGCAEKGLDVTQGGAELNFTTIEAVTFATTVDLLLAVKYLVFDKKFCTMKELLQALRAHWTGWETLQAQALNKAPKYGRDDDEADKMALKVMELWTEETWKHKTISTGRQFRPGMLSWNYWVSDGYILPASPDGRPNGNILSNALCPSNGTHINGATADVNSVGKAMGGKIAGWQEVDPDKPWKGFANLLPNGSSHTMTFNPSLLRSPEHKAKFKAFLMGYMENGGTTLQINVVDADMLRDAQAHPENYRHLPVRLTGYQEV